jgi:hypothetical protein
MGICVCLGENENEAKKAVWTRNAANPPDTGFKALRITDDTTTAEMLN